MFTTGFSFAIGVYYVEFLDVFNESRATTAWISSLNFGVMCFIGKVGNCVNLRAGNRVVKG